MFEAWRQHGAEVAVIGLGRSGVAAARLLRRAGCAVYASDAGAAADLPADLEAMGVVVDRGGHDLARIRRATAAVVSPGVPPDAPPIAAARAAGVAVVAEVDIAVQALGPSVAMVAVTGTNGKTTTTALAGHLLAAAGTEVEVAGNIGRPLSEVALLDSRPAWVVAELSSFQLHDAPHLRPSVGILTNLAPDHLDRYASLEAYYADKALLFRNAGPQDTWVSNGDDCAVVDMVAGVPGLHRRFSVTGPADAWYDRSAATLMIGSEPFLPRERVPLLGDHNVANVLAAVLACRAAGAALASLAGGVPTFRGLPHRLEVVGTVGDVVYINDSKATNIASTAVALTAVDRPYVLLLGGRHKGDPYTRLVPLLSRCRAVVAFGEARPLIERDLDGAVPVVGAASWPEALAAARRAARPGDAVLLSPACSSYDMFQNYEDRGRQFRAAVQEP